MKVYTDYPLIENTPTQMYVVDVLAYDRNKYLALQYNDEIHWVKAGYVYKDPVSYKTLSRNALLKLPVRVGLMAPSRKEVAREIKLGRAKKTIYTVVTDTHTTVYKNLNKALNRFKQTWRSTETKLFRKVSRSYSFSHECLLYSEDGEMTIPYHGHRHNVVLKNRNINKVY